MSTQDFNKAIERMKARGASKEDVFAVCARRMQESAEGLRKLIDCECGGKRSVFTGMCNICGKVRE